MIESTVTCCSACQPHTHTNLCSHKEVTDRFRPQQPSPSSINITTLILYKCNNRQTCPISMFRAPTCRVKFIILFAFSSLHLNTRKESELVQQQRAGSVCITSLAQLSPSLTWKNTLVLNGVRTIGPQNPIKAIYKTRHLGSKDGADPDQPAPTTQKEQFNQDIHLLSLAKSCVDQNQAFSWYKL